MNLWLRMRPVWRSTAPRRYLTFYGGRRLLGGMMMGRTWVALQALPSAYKSAGFTLLHLTAAVCAGVGIVVGGALLERILRTGTGQWNVSGGMVCLAVVQLSMLLMWWPKRRLIGFDQQVSASELMRAGFRRLTGGSGGEE